MNATITQFESRVERAWRAYLEAKDRAEATRSMEDGIAADEAWNRFMNLQLPENHRETSKYVQAVMRQNGGVR